MALLRSDPAPAEPAPLRDVAFALPAPLRGFGGSGRATLVGRAGAPAVVMIGGISGSRFPCLHGDGRPGWWSGLAGPGRLIDPDRYRIVGIDFIADDSGSRAPTPRDQAEMLAAALDALEIHSAHALIGASYGGMIGLSFAETWPDRLGKLVVLCADAEPDPTSTACRELQRRVVKLGLEAGQGEEALAIARGMAMLTYRSPEEFRQRFKGGIAGPDPLDRSEPGAYLRARGAAYPSVMSPGRFLSLSASIDRHRCRPERIATPAILIGALSDRLVPPEQMQQLASALAGPVELHLLPSIYGHDMFLKECERLEQVLRPAF